MSPYTTMLCAVGSCINKELPLSDETVKIMERVLPIDDWAEYYSRYHGHDIYCWGRPDGSVPYDTYHQSFRYVYFIQVSVLALIFITVVLKYNWNALQGFDRPKEIFDKRSESEEYNG